MRSDLFYPIFQHLQDVKTAHAFGKAYVAETDTTLHETHVILQEIREIAYRQCMNTIKYVLKRDNNSDDSNTMFIGKSFISAICINGRSYSIYSIVKSKQLGLMKLRNMFGLSQSSNIITRSKTAIYTYTMPVVEFCVMRKMLNIESGIVTPMIIGKYIICDHVCKCIYKR